MVSAFRLLAAFLAVGGLGMPPIVLFAPSKNPEDEQRIDAEGGAIAYSR